MFFGGDPFSHFGGGGGGGGGRGGGGNKEPVDSNAYYETLGIAKDADEKAIRKAYRNLAVKHHPDKGGDAEKFKEISSAYETLSDPEKRKLYDQYGKEGVEQGGGGGHQSADDIFSMFFGGGRGRGPQGPQRGEDITHPIKASLEDLYNGKTSRLAINRNKLCEDCEGRGGKTGSEKTCQDCGGRGVRVQLRQIGPGMVQQMQSACGACSGKGKTMEERDKCKSCKGKKVYKDRKVLDVLIEKGMRNGQKIRFGGESDEGPDIVPGDVVFIVEEKPHDLFKRKGADLIYEMKLSLSEALCGFTRTITHLDGRVLKISSRVGQVTKPDALKMINGEGMPYHGNPFTKGRLFVHFSVEFPSSLSASVVSSIKAVLPAPPAIVLNGEEEECNLSDANVNQIGQGSENVSQEDDPDTPQGQQKVQCNQG